MSKLYSELKVEGLALLESGTLPSNVMFAGGSAFCRDVKGLIEGIIKNIDNSLKTVDPSRYEKESMRREKDRLYQVIEAVKNPENCDVNVIEWRESKGRFGNFQFKPE